MKICEITSKLNEVSAGQLAQAAGSGAFPVASAGAQVAKAVAPKWQPTQGEIENPGTLIAQGTKDLAKNTARETTVKLSEPEVEAAIEGALPRALTQLAEEGTPVIGTAVALCFAAWNIAHKNWTGAAAAGVAAIPFGVVPAIAMDCSNALYRECYHKPNGQPADVGIDLANDPAGTKSRLSELAHKIGEKIKQAMAQGHEKLAAMANQQRQQHPVQTSVTGHHQTESLDRILDLSLVKKPA